MIPTEDLWLYGAPSCLGLLALITIVSVRRRTREIIRHLDNDKDITLRLEDEHGDDRLIAALRRYVLGPASQVDPRLVLTRPLADVRREYAEDAVAHYWSFWAGTLLTGLALLCTFILIGYVMTTDVSGAIRDSADSSMHLAQAVQKLGAKFYISAAGIGGSVIALWFSNVSKAQIFQRTDRPSPDLARNFLSVEGYRLQLARSEADNRAREHQETLDLRARQHHDVYQWLSSLAAGMEKLHRIEVSVKQIGNEVSANLKDVMKTAMAEQLKDILATMMVEVSELAERVKESLTKSLRDQVEKLTSQLQESLSAVQGAVQSQGEGQLEQILDKLQATVSGGFHSESQKMAVALEQFASAIPTLEQQLRAMTGKVAEESRQRTQESAEFTHSLLDRVASLIENMGAQQAEGARAIEQMQATAAHAAEEIARRLEASGAGVVNTVLGASRTQVEAIAEHLRAATEASATRYGDMEIHAAGASAAVTDACDALAGQAKSIAALTTSIANVMVDARKSSEIMASVSREFSSAGAGLRPFMDAMKQVIDQARAQVQAQQELLGRQRDYTKEVERLWPQLFDTYLTKFKTTSEQLGRSWADLHQKVTSLTTSIGVEFSESTQTLSEAVDRLASLTKHSRS